MSGGCAASGSASATDVLAGSAAWAVECTRAEVMCDALPDSSVDLVVVDHPYHKVKAEAWDREQEDAAGFLDWTRSMVRRYRRILRPNGSLYVFASPDMGARVECVVREEMRVLTNIRWKKDEGFHKTSEKEALRAPFPASETIIFAEQNPQWPAVLRGLREAAGMSRQDVSDHVVGSRSGAAWNWEAGIRLPEAHHWAKLQELFPMLPAYETEVRPFTVSAEVPYTDVWEFQTVQAYPGKHPCEKPPDMAEHIVNSSSRPGAVVADFFCGSGVFLAEAVRLGRRAIGCDMSPKWARRARQSIERPRVKLREAPPADGRQLNWLESA